ncbi:MAG: hypothetical protein RL414_785 [Actinomycetota bacterium]
MKLARCLTLALLVTKVVANDHDATITTNDFALVANLLHAWLYLHDVPSFFLLVTINNATSCKVIWTEFYNHTIFRKNTNVVLSHLSGDMCKHNMSIC